MIKSDFPPHAGDFGSDFDPVLHGVARALGDLFPPIHATIEDASFEADEDEDGDAPANR